VDNFDLEAGKRFREEGDLVEAIRCLKSALEQDKDCIEPYVELARTYLVAFHESGDPLCLDAAREVGMAALRRDPGYEDRQVLTALQDRVDALLLESQKAEMDAMSAAMDGVGLGPALLPDDEAEVRPLDDFADRRGEGSDEEPDH
jgi:hypothetical protein